MRMFALPAAFVLSLCLYLPLPRAQETIFSLLRRLHARFLPRLRSERRALLAFVLAVFALSALLCAVHPIVCCLLMVPLFAYGAVFPHCAAVKSELDSGKYSRDIPAYESLVRSTCLKVAPAFVLGAVAPMLLCAAGIVLHMGCAPAWAFCALLAVDADQSPLGRIPAQAERISDRLLSALMVLCSGVVGRSPLRTRGEDAVSRMMNTIGIAGDGTDTHAPMSGDISQAAFLCCFCCGLLLFTLTAVGFVLCG